MVLVVSVDLLDPWDHLDWLEPLESPDVRCEDITMYPAWAVCLMVAY